jgi:hypothetical protein
MAKKKNRHGRPIGGQFTPILHEIQDSIAYKKLSGNSAKLYHRMERIARTVAHNMDCDVNDAQFNFTYSEIKKTLGFSESTARRCLEKLWEKGFISVIQIGGRTASNKGGRMSSIYQLCGNWKTYQHQWTDRTKYEVNPWSSPSEPRDNEASRW